MRVAIDIVNARRERLRELIHVDGFLPVAEICRRLEISEATARRDLAVIAGEGHITRTRGGARANYNASFDSLAQRSHRARRPKEKIALAALALLPPKGTVFLDAGTTILAVARALGRKRGATTPQVGYACDIPVVDAASGRAARSRNHGIPMTTYA